MSQAADRGSHRAQDRTWTIQAEHQARIVQGAASGDCGETEGIVPAADAGRTLFHAMNNWIPDQRAVGANPDIARRSRNKHRNIGAG
jgi:hypothetical protein